MQIGASEFRRCTRGVWVNDRDRVRVLLGFGATLAEPALNALGLTVQNLTNGAFKKSMLMYSVATGVAVNR